ncbi:phospholipase D family member 5 [Ictidomys tridecemlineatus]|nr:phospholipase D family member 5 [Ictidomys tridecemlineatus]
MEIRQHEWLSASPHEGFEQMRLKSRPKEPSPSLTRVGANFYSSVKQQDYSASVWLRRKDKLEHSQQKCIVIFALVCCFAILVALIFSAVDIMGEDEDGLSEKNCQNKCRIALVENIPEGLNYSENAPFHLSLFQGWMNLLNMAKKSVDIVSSHWDLNHTHPSACQGQRLFEKLLQLTSQNIEIKLVSDVTADSKVLEALKLKGAEVTYMNMTAYNKGRLQSSFWIVDKQHVYIGSAGLDWRSLGQMKELGVIFYNCSCLVLDLQRIFALYSSLKFKSRVPQTWLPYLIGLRMSNESSQSSVVLQRQSSCSEPAFMGHFMVLQDSGAGSFAQVKPACHPTTWTEVSVKVLVKHASGGQLWDLILETDGMLEEEAHRLCRQISWTLKYYHQKGIVHLDLKLENAVVDAISNVKLINFDLSTRFTAGKKLKRSFGTLLYTDSESVRGQQINLGVLSSQNSPKLFCPKNRSFDIDAIYSVIDDAKQYVYIAVMDYLPISSTSTKRTYWPDLDGKIREALVLRSVKVRLLISFWKETDPLTFNFISSLKAICTEIANCSLKVKFFDLERENACATKEQKNHTFPKLNRNKYMVTDGAAYIGNFDWVGNDFTQNAGTGLVINQADVRNNRSIIKQLKDVFERDWYSPYAKTLQPTKQPNCSSLFKLSHPSNKTATHNTSGKEPLSA